MRVTQESCGKSLLFNNPFAFLLSLAVWKSLSRTEWDCRKTLRSTGGVVGIETVCVPKISQVVRAELIDFKTDMRPKNKNLDEWIGERVMYHGPQLRAYGVAIQKQYGLKSSDVELTLLLLGEDRIVTIPNP